MADHDHLDAGQLAQILALKFFQDAVESAQETARDQVDFEWALRLAAGIFTAASSMLTSAHECHLTPESALEEIALQIARVERGEL